MTARLRDKFQANVGLLIFFLMFAYFVVLFLSFFFQHKYILVCRKCSYFEVKQFDFVSTTSEGQAGK